MTLALDDFGTGYSAITALHRLPIHTLKIDRSFVADVVAEPATAALVQGLLQLGRGMGLQVIAEGIEDLDQARLAARPRLRHGAGLRVRPARTAAQPGRRCSSARSPTTPAEDVAGELLSRRARDPDRPAAAPGRRAGRTRRVVLATDDTGGSGCSTTSPTSPRT